MTERTETVIADEGVERRFGRLRPQLVILILIALVPYDGLLLLVPGGGAFDGWKIVLVAFAFGLSILESPTRGISRRAPRWALPLVLLLALSLVSIAINPAWQSVVGFRISYIYLLVPLILWRSPLDRIDRDRMVTILMVNAAITSLVGIGQQIVGAEVLNTLGYEYNSVIRTSNGFLRSFSTFSQPFPFAFFVMGAVLLCLPVALEDRTRLRNRVFLFALPVLVIGLGTAIVRGAFLGLVVGLVYLGVARYRILAHALFAVPLVVALLLVSSVGGALFSSSSLNQRSTGWATEVFDRPLRPLGQGIGTTGATAELFESSGTPAGELLANDDGGRRYQADNHYVKMLIELGPVGLWLFVWVVGAAVVEGHRRSRMLTSSDEEVDRGLSFGITGATVGAVAAATVATYWEIFPADLLFWSYLGVLSSLRHQSS